MLPEHSTPATPDAANASVEPAAFDKLKADFSSCLLPYSQALDVSRTYLGQLGSCRFEEMRTFRRCITEFVLDPAQEPAGFETGGGAARYAIDTAIEYLGITPEEYATAVPGDPGTALRARPAQCPQRCAPASRDPARRSRQPADSARHDRRCPRSSPRPA